MVKDYRQQTIFVPNIFVMISPRHKLIFVKHELRLAQPTTSMSRHVLRDFDVADRIKVTLYRFGAIVPGGPCPDHA